MANWCHSQVVRQRSAKPLFPGSNPGGTSSLFTGCFVRHSIQVSPEHYRFEAYDDKERWGSYWHQIRAALLLKPNTVLEIGLGTGVFRAYLLQAGVDVKTADIDSSRQPDFLADICQLDEALPPGVTFDIVAAFQVLEHLPFDQLDGCLAGIAKRASPYALISLPVHGVQVRGSFAIGDWKLSFGTKVRKPWRFRPNREHYWEIGWGYSIRKISRIMERYFEVEDARYVSENPYHYLWVLRAKPA